MLLCNDCWEARPSQSLNDSSLHWRPHRPLRLHASGGAPNLLLLLLFTLP